MPISHLVLALIVVIVWGCNFIFVKFAIDEMSPILLCAVRFLLASIPAIFFIKLPAAPLRITILYGLLTFALQFTLLFSGMAAGMPAGLTSLLLQVQVFFSILFAAVLLEESPTFWQIAGALVAFLGIIIVASHFDNHVTLLGFLLILAASASWGAGNLISKLAGKINMMALVVWGSFFSSIPLVILTLIIDGPERIHLTLQHLSTKGIISILYIVYASTWVGYGIWNWLVSRYAVATIVPFTLLVPVCAIICSVIILNEPMQAWKLFAGSLVILGLCINLLGPKLLGKKAITTHFIPKDAD